ncbi:MAG: hypothetical protein A3I44_05485 [Candidatus Sungbacteria bacterium RIFCSPLOWO2_02_FULL_51_17]|uniref:Uncharacterized protein n=1 Tax=Candidatus Sungbacteria bacterium RIFCSPHIGHO2_02_FULL_51_29 TaxID=1802273 RepID=A0A1G2KU62_9BACT|nr:MAG: hypothetical protein A2676_06050 [Candidatus Sungbacteria bacterium RIFCSPHIGHO2_01_FULL_51_22]OHA01961.1 MAG: hypothetical protein A3C16_02365 [Candidatus Sungbacteria bacterium RIFCSPHIGHO2_02_FULL_51_29]OHA05078.1 MAG: hypothetical protein A3B29_00350 [Candidatus Sungbacteria bacterium RIFCSPLOWO2_01_FULL_51_34]OHA11147.1 MAG: hypothetical protein A3I44_05485 [Candidatus Sungbacteria bacterium RIFCSPLOWO2_02_FULL_51_17]
MYFYPRTPAPEDPLPLQVRRGTLEEVLTVVFIMPPFLLTGELLILLMSGFVLIDEGFLKTSR